ncbi:hypothetical protein DSM3645_21097 [Blastopirellula marina DSM 3645]|uniref:Uncharacterized protein n=1 Tax=Blastopirellula marina DSM 3645 TaxID=314230 RepID=A3ZR16_9BACT|nr:hypothetical protein DSM3645_21097 [Blastopirellula marina DSM 3645]
MDPEPDDLLEIDRGSWEGESWLIRPRDLTLTLQRCNQHREESR